MSLKSKFLSLITVAVGVAAFAPGAMAQDSTTGTTKGDTVTQDKPMHRHGGREGFRDGHRKGPGSMMFGLRGVNLTDAQKQQIHTIMESNKPEQASMDQMRSLMEAKRNGTITPEQQEQLKAFKQQQRVKGESIHQQIQAILTPEQLQQVEKNKQEMKERREKFRQMREQNKQTPDKEPVSN